MEEFDKDQVIEWYNWLEELLLDIMKILPPAPGNLESYSPRLASIILDACGLLDSIFRQITPNEELSTIKKNKKGKEPDVKDFAELYSDEFDLPRIKSIPFISPPKYFCPFKPWEAISSGGDYKPLDWWQTYNDLKHDRIANIKKAGLGNALDALCGLHQVITVVPAFSKAILRAGWIETSEVNPEELLEIMEGRSAPGPGSGFLVESKLFIVPVGIHMPEDIDSFRPLGWCASQRAVQFFGRW